MNITRKGLGFAYDKDTDVVYLYYKVDKARDYDGILLTEPVYCEIKSTPVADKPLDAEDQDYSQLVNEIKEFFFDNYGKDKIVTPIMPEEYQEHLAKAELQEQPKDATLHYGPLAAPSNE